MLIAQFFYRHAMASEQGQAPTCTPSAPRRKLLPTLLSVFMLQALDEIHAGIFDGMSYEQIEEQQPEEFRARKSDKLRYRCSWHSL